MIHHLVLCQLSAGTDGERIEWMMRQTRSLLLKIPEVLSVRCGQNLDPSSEWGFFFSVEIESTEKFASYCEHPVHVKFVEEVIKPWTAGSKSLDFETEPGKDLRLS